MRPSAASRNPACFLVRNAAAGAWILNQRKYCAIAAKEKKVKRGVKEVVKSIRKKQKGICIIAGDISPIDVISHVPIMCEDSGIQYCYVTSKEALGAAGRCVEFIHPVCSLHFVHGSEGSAVCTAPSARPA